MWCMKFCFLVPSPTPKPNPKKDRQSNETGIWSDPDIFVRKNSTVWRKSCFGCLRWSLNPPKHAHTQGKHLANMMLSTHWSLHPGMLLRQLWQIFLSSTELRWLCSLLCCPEVSSVPLRNYCWRYRHLCLLHLRRYTRYGSIHWQCVYLRWQCYCRSGNFTWYGTMLPSTPFSNVFVTSVTRPFHIVSHCFTLSLEWVSACKMLNIFAYPSHHWGIS